MKIDKEIIKQRKAIYGDNFPEIAELWTKYLNSKLGVMGRFKVTEKDVAEMMALMKKVRIEKGQELISKETDPAKREMLLKGVEDSIKDMNNYKWIAENYNEYKEL
jgi:hypothetical protein